MLLGYYYNDDSSLCETIVQHNLLYEDQQII